jgi:hypothetical protein
VDFEINLTQLGTLRTRLATLHAELMSGPTSPSSVRMNLDPKSFTLPDAMRGNADEIAAYAYGRLFESDPLGAAHEMVAASVLDLVNRLEHMIETMITSAGAGVEHYAEAEASVESAIAAASGTSGAGSAGGDWAGGAR